MVRTDWDRIFSLNPSSLTDDEIEDLCPTIIHCQVEEINDLHNLRTLVKLSQETLQYKDGQVESLLLECGELKELVSSLKSQVAKREKKEPRKEADSINDASINYEDTVRKKNEKIESLMAELETVDRENAMLKDSLTMLREEMEDATEKMNRATEELNLLRKNINEYAERISELERENSALVAQIEEISAQQNVKDKIIDEFGAAIDARVSEWKAILDEKDAEIASLRENLSRSLMHSVRPSEQENQRQISSLTEEISRREAIINELQKKLAESVVVINENAALVEKLKIEAKKAEKVERKSGQRDLLGKLREANERIANLQEKLQQAEEDIDAKSSKLCEVLSILKKYEDKDGGLADALSNVKFLENELRKKNEHVEDLIGVVNKLEMLNSYQEMEILTLRDRLGISKDEQVSVEGATERFKEQAKKMETLVAQNKMLVQENIEMKSDIRTLRHKLKRSKSMADEVDEPSKKFLHSTRITETPGNEISGGNMEMAFREENISEIETNAQLIVEENEALRQGMHEILDSIRNQDGKSSVEVQSSILEKLLEALDVRHLAGWYHPAMRLQERLNVIQGSNAELRSQLKQLRKELERKDEILQELLTGKGRKLEEFFAEEKGREDEKSLYESEIENLRSAGEQQIEEWEKEKSVLTREISELREENGRLREQLQEYESNWRIMESGEDEIRREFGAKAKECLDLKTEVHDLRRKQGILEGILAEESSKAYRREKEFLARQANLEKVLVDAEKRCSLLEREVSTLRTNLLASVGFLEHEKLKGEYQTVCTRLRVLTENFLTDGEGSQIALLKADLEMAERQKEELLRVVRDLKNDDNLEDQLRKSKANELIEKQRADRLEKLHQVLEDQLTKCQEELKHASSAKSQLQEQLSELQKKFSKDLRPQNCDPKSQEAKITQLRDNIEVLRIENDNLRKKLEIAEEEARLQFGVNALRTLELDELRHQILDLQALSEDKAIISRLAFELANLKTVETELDVKRRKLEAEVVQLRKELEKSRTRCEEMRIRSQECRKQCEDRCRYYIEVIQFLQEQYSGSTSISALERITSLISQLKSDRRNVDFAMKKAKEYQENAKLQQDLLVSRLEIVEKLKDILEQQIGNGDVEEMLHRFSEDAQRTLNDFKYSRKITNLEYELKTANEKIAEYESKMLKMEEEMIEIQRVWHNPQQLKMAEDKVRTPAINVESVFVQAEVEKYTAEVQTDSYKCCLNEEKEEEEDSNKKDEDKTREDTKEKPVEDDKDGKNVKESVETVEELIDQAANDVGLGEQLQNALKLASDRSTAIVEYKSQITECRATVDALNRTIRDKDALLAEKEKAIEDFRLRWNTENVERSDGHALKSTINSLQKIVSQKEETILRYQNLLKEERAEHNRTELRLEEELKNLRERLVLVEGRAQKEPEVREFKVPEKVIELGQGDSKGNAVDEEELARLTEKISTLEADLNFAKELSERWRRLAEERLEHMDGMREKLEEQHKQELESYRLELRKWQSEADLTRQQLSESRVLLSKGNISLSRELQDRDDKINELTLTCQRLQNEIEMLESANQGQKMSKNAKHDSVMREMVDSGNRDQSQQSQLRRQLQTLMEKEKSYKHEIADLKQRLSRRYMAMKTQEKKTSQRELQLERKVKTLEEELQRAQAQLDREFLAQELKRVKTAEELSLWDKQKRWQQTAEKLKEKLREKTEECAKLQSNCDRLRSIISCMEREKWCLQGKIRAESVSTAGNLSARPASVAQDRLLTDLRDECQALRNRVNELTDRLEHENSKELAAKVEEQKRRIEALEIAAQGNSHVVDQLEKLERARDMLEKVNVKLEAENFQLRFDVEKSNTEMPKLRQKVDHLTKYIELLKAEKSSDSASSLQDNTDACKKSGTEMQKTIFALRRIIERLQAENKRLKMNSKGSHRFSKEVKLPRDTETLQSQYEEARKRCVALEVDLQLAEQRIAMLETALHENDTSGEKDMLRQQLLQKSDLLDKVKQLLARAAINEKNLRRRVQQLESRQGLSAIPECYVTPATPRE